MASEAWEELPSQRSSLPPASALGGNSTTTTTMNDSISAGKAAHSAKTEGNAGFLRAARAGHLDKVNQYLKASTDINTSNANGLNALHLASKEGHQNVVTELLKNGANIDAATKKGNTALHIASLAGQEAVVQTLVNGGASVNTQSQNGFTPLYMAAQENHASVVKFLLGSGASQSLATEDGFTPLAVALQQGHNRVVAVLLESDSRGRVRLPALHIAAKKDDIKAATLLLDSDHNVDGTSKSGFTPLHIASHYGNVNMGALLLEKGANPNYKARNAIMPLHVASKWGRTGIVNVLLDSGAEVDGQTRDGLTPLHCACRSGHEKVVDLMLEKGASVSTKTKNGLSPLHMAAQGDHADCARLLLFSQAPIDDVTVDYLTPLHVASHCGNVRTAKLLLEKKCEVNARALNGFTPLHIACKKNRIKVIELLLKYGGSIEATTESGLTPLHVAAFMGHMQIVTFLIAEGANPNASTVRGETALHLAARASQTDIIRVLLRNGAQVDARAREQQTPLHIAARLGSVDNVLLLLQHGAAVDAATNDLYTPLHIAAKEGHEEVASVLLEHGAPLNVTTKKGFSPLHISAKYGNMQVARLLLQREADPNVQGKNGLTPLHVATHYNNPNVALLLLENRASPHCTAKNGYTPLHIAAKKNQMDIATTLLEFGAKPNDESKSGFTPLHLASQEGHTDMVSLLLEHGATVGNRAKNGLAPMHLAAQEDKVPVAEVLVKYGAEIDPQTKAGYTPLHTSCHFGQINMIRFLLEHAASVNATTKMGYTPLHQAAQQGHVLVINLLLKYKASPNAVTNTGQTPLSVAQRLGYISVVEVLKHVTDVTITTTTIEEKYKVVSPETMTDTLMTDSEDEGEGDTELADRPYNFLTSDDMKMLGDDSISPMKDDRDMRFFDRFGTLSSSITHTPDDSRYLSLDPADDLPVFTRLESTPKQEEPLRAAQLAPAVYAAPRAAAEESRTSAVYGSYSGVSFASSFDPDNVAVDRQPIYSGFLVSFMVDARGGAMRGCRHSGVRIIVPPGRACMPMRVTCKLVKKEKLSCPPPLMEGEALASRVLEMGPVNAKFLGPVIIEVPQFASLRGCEREIVILRSDDGETWHEHALDSNEDALHQALNGSFEDLESAEDLYHRRITRIITAEFPHYFAIVTRIRQETAAVGRDGGLLSSTVVPQVQAQFPDGALTKKIRVGLQAQPVPADLVAKMLGNRVAVSPIVTVEPRRRKFHKPITLTIPMPKAAQKGMINQYGSDAPTLRLLCSITGVDAFANLKGEIVVVDPVGEGGSSPAQWEDITGTTPLTFINDCVSFTTTVSARFWLMDCQNINDAAKMASELYREAIAVPFMSKFVVFARRREPQEAQLRVFCMTDDKMDKTLELQEHFSEVARSRDVEVLEGRAQYIEMGGNLVPVTKSGDQLHLGFHAFRENRLPFVVRVRDTHADAVGRVAFMREPKVSRGEAPQTPICTLNIVVPEISVADTQNLLDADDLKQKYKLRDGDKSAFLLSTNGDESISKAELRLTDIADTLQGDWLVLARLLHVSDEEITRIQTEYSYVSEQALMMLHLWVQDNSGHATGNELERALKKIGREDVIVKCMYNIEEVTDAVEKAAAKTELDQPGFDELKEELEGAAPDTLPLRGDSLEVSYDEQDMVKDSESAAEEDSVSDASSVVERVEVAPGVPVDDKPEEENEADRDRKREAYVALAQQLDEDEELVVPPTDEEGAEVSVEDLVARVAEADVQAEPEERAELVESVEPVELVEPAEPVEPAESVEPAEPAEPAERAEPVEPVESPVELVEPEEPIQQVEQQQLLLADASGSDVEDAAIGPGPTACMRVFTETEECEPEVETDVQETDETLPDGTVVRRKVTRTKQRQTVIKRVVMEGVMSDGAAADDLEMRLYGDRVSGAPETSDDVQEFKETLPDGTVVTRRVMVQRTRQLTTDRTIIDGAGDMFDFSDAKAVESGPATTETADTVEAAQWTRDEAAVAEDVADDADVDISEETETALRDEAIGGEEAEDGVQQSRLTMKKQVHKKTVMRNGEEETVIIEDIQVEQDSEAPEELQESMHSIIDQFMEGGAGPPATKPQ